MPSPRKKHQYVSLEDKIECNTELAVTSFHEHLDKQKIIYQFWLKVTKLVGQNIKRYTNDNIRYVLYFLLWLLFLLEIYNNLMYFEEFKYACTGNNYQYFQMEVLNIYQT